MELTEFTTLSRSLIDKCLALSESKSHDYATIDVLSNFKRVSAIAKLYNITFKAPYEYAMFMVLMKLDRFQNLMTQIKTPKNESLEDTVQDAVNYLLLMNACLEEQKSAMVV
jgi:hypothetical protein